MSRKRNKPKPSPDLPVQAAPTKNPQGPPERRGLLAWGVFFFLLVVYHLNGDFLPGNDAKSNMFLPVSLLTEGDMSFTPDEAPFMFNWVLRTAEGLRPMTFNSEQWDVQVGGNTVRAHYEAGRLIPVQMKYYIVPARRGGKPDTQLGVSTFGPGAGLCALPIFAVLQAVTGDLTTHPEVLWYGAKFVASALVAASAAFLFLVACGFVGRWKALIVALAYGLGTCVWSTSSQALWQHGPNEFFLALGTLLLTRVERGRRQAALCGLAFACAVACRPTSVLVCVAVGGYLLLARRRALLPYVLGALPVALLLAAYNWHYFESPFTFGQGIVGEKVAQYKTGSTNLWQTPIWVGAAGLIFSPSRGLLVYSPFMIFAFWGLVRVWRETKYAAFRPLTVAMLGLLGIAFCWFDWWGGWCFGYRPIVDTMPFFALLLIPMVDTILSRRWLTAVAAALLAWSIFVQVLGAWAYNLAGWNAKFTAVLRMPGKAETVAVHTEEDMRAWVQAGAEVLSAEREDIDSPDNRDRLWSLTDTQIRYNIENFWYSRDTKQDRMQQSMQKLEQ